jgi:carbon monoxide dehydrogenase subunit G
MKHQVEATLNLPRRRVVALFDDPDNLAKWQPGLQSFKLLQGEPGQSGARSRLIYDMNGRKVEMIETVEKRALPHTFSGTYEADGVWNRVEKHFFEDEPGRTRWITDVEYKFSGLMRLMATFMRRSFRKQTAESMQRFKDFAQAETPKGFINTRAER